MADLIGTEIRLCSMQSMDLSELLQGLIMYKEFGILSTCGIWFNVPILIGRAAEQNWHPTLAMDLYF